MNSKQLTVPIAELAARAMELRDEGYNKGRWEIYDKDKRIVIVRAWRFHQEKGRS